MLRWVVNGKTWPTLVAVCREYGCEDGRANGAGLVFAVGWGCRIICMGKGDSRQSCKPRQSIVDRAKIWQHAFEERRKDYNG